MISQPKKVDEPDNFFGDICLPSTSLCIKNCKFEIVLAQPKRLASSMVIIPYFHDNLREYDHILLSKRERQKYEKSLKKVSYKEG